MTAPVICLITDRLRLATALSAASASASQAAADAGIWNTPHVLDAVVEQVRAAALAGVHLVQIRERDLEGRALFDLVSRAVAAVRGTPARVIVNDRLDVAMAAGADGVHLRDVSFAATAVRAIAPRRFLVGRSVHDVEGARRVDAEGGVDYLVFGSVYATRSKPGRSEAGIDALRAVVKTTALPVLAVGGVTPDKVGPVAAAGAAGVAAIGWFTRPPQLMAEAVAALRDGRAERVNG